MHLEGLRRLGYPELFSKKYFDLSPGTIDVKWVGWIGAILVDLGMVDLDENQTFFK